jgi:hypothetical protein
MIYRKSTYDIVINDKSEWNYAEIFYKTKNSYNSKKKSTSLFDFIVSYYQ